MSDEGDEEEEVERVRAYKSWKSVILLYEFAQALSIFHTIMFFGFWRENVLNYYDSNEYSPSTRTLRVILLYVINTFPPACMLFDMAFSKILFRLRHFWVGLLCSAIFLGIQYLGKTSVISDEFPKGVEDLPGIWQRAAALGGYIVIHGVLWLFSLIKIRITNSPTYLASRRKTHFDKDVRLEYVIKKYDKLLKSQEKHRREYLRLETGEESSCDIYNEDNPQLNFMREVLYNYLDKEIKLERIYSLRSN
uniref:Uncharacterized protein n=1 Tax=Euplotes crassus TaxID=5936 RepID=A0A7S3KGG7_EUPCR|mmetsp:Transcript_26214/g.26103  ORF Transcript_26214/g.26103 Transcript_26214/m.26103 type:complete len:250 (+) Transcript_26214:329-1078(+)